MEVITWNIRGVNNPGKMRTLRNKLRKEKPDVLFLQETKCSSDTMQTFRSKLWRGSLGITIDAIRATSGIDILWQPDTLHLNNFRETRFSISVELQV